VIKDNQDKTVEFESDALTGDNEILLVLIPNMNITVTKMNLPCCNNGCL